MPWWASSDIKDPSLRYSHSGYVNIGGRNDLRQTQKSWWASLGLGSLDLVISRRGDELGVYIISRDTAPSVSQNSLVWRILVCILECIYWRYTIAEEWNLTSIESTISARQIQLISQIVMMRIVYLSAEEPHRTGGIANVQTRSGQMMCWFSRKKMGTTMRLRASSFMVLWLLK